MLKNAIEKKVNEWAKTDEAIREVNQQIIYLEKRLFQDYMPCLPPGPQFYLRLDKWIANAKKMSDQKLLFELVPEIFYVSNSEFNALYKAAYNVAVSKWLIDCIGLKFNDVDAAEKLKSAVEETWFCAATDSFRINDFFKINNIPSQYDYRPDWHSLSELGDAVTIKKYVAKHKIQRIVMLEDFVGSGTQVESAIKFLCSTLPDVDVLVISLITCFDGVINFEKLPTAHTRLTIEHIIEIEKHFFISEAEVTSEPTFHKSTRELATRLYALTTDGKNNPNIKPYYPLGYRKTGALIVLYSNTPDNTLPLIHWESKSWYPLFKRITRV